MNSHGAKNQGYEGFKGYRNEKNDQSNHDRIDFDRRHSLFRDR